MVLEDVTNMPSGQPHADRWNDAPDHKGDFADNGGDAGPWNSNSGFQNTSKHEDGLDVSDETCRKYVPFLRSKIETYLADKITAVVRKVISPEIALSPRKGWVLALTVARKGHLTLDCKNPRAFDRSNVADMDGDKAWEVLKVADKERDLDAFRESLLVYTKAVPDTTFIQLEKAFRLQGFQVHLIAIEKQIPKTQTIVDLQGKLDLTYQVQFHFAARPRRKVANAGWPENPEDNLTRLENAGFVQDRGVSQCAVCSELGHTAKFCKEERVQVDRVVVKCFNCNEEGHRSRDCPQERVDRNACRNCKQSGHQASECPEPRSAAGVECKKCSEIGHFARDCPTGGGGGGGGCRNCGQEGHMARDCEEPRNPATVTCRNCEKTGHFSKECPEPRDYSKVKCSNCGEMGHTIRRCKQPVPDEGGDLGGFEDTQTGANDVSNGNSGGGFDSGAGGSSDWEKGGAPAAGGGW
ncbi:MAG: hypothetical protein M4579_005205 [Chaenotheca gracillima]|nr:MAG: hypothetical protein M4579_005205 [Chaenotheca gracillima]